MSTYCLYAGIITEQIITNKIKFTFHLKILHHHMYMCLLYRLYSTILYIENFTMSSSNSATEQSTVKKMPYKSPKFKHKKVQCDTTANVQQSLICHMQRLICHMMKWYTSITMVLCSIGIIYYVYYAFCEPFIQTDMGYGSPYDCRLYHENSMYDIQQQNFSVMNCMKQGTITQYIEDNHKPMNKGKHYIYQKFKPDFYSDYECINYTFTAYYDIQIIKVRLVNPVCQCITLRKEEYRYRLSLILINYDYHGHFKIKFANKFTHERLHGGGTMATWLFSELEKYAVKPYPYSMDDVFEYGVHVPREQLHKYTRGVLCYANVPLWLLSRADKQTLLSICKQHSIDVTYRTKVNDIRSQMNQHNSCDECKNCITVFSYINTPKIHSMVSSPPPPPKKKHSNFPPSPPDNKLIADVINGYCDDITPESIKEDGCAICGCVCPLNHLTNLLKAKLNLEILTMHGVTRKERLNKSNPIQELSGPVIHDTLSNICKDCISYMENGKLPPNSLANGNWIGNIPSVLQNLSWVEKLLISRVCHNRCVVRVLSSGMHKLASNAVFFSTPMPKVYKALPPSLPELDEVLAFVYLGPTCPTEKEFKCIPLLVRQNKVAMALEWLKLNHIDYTDLNISYENLNSYPENEPPVQVDYHYKEVTEQAENSAVTKIETDNAVSDGECPFIVHGLTGIQIESQSAKAL